MPSQWEVPSFYDLRAQGGFLVNALNKMVKTQWVQIKSSAGEPSVLKINDWPKLPISSNNKIVVKKINQGEFEILLKKEQTVLLKTTSTNPTLLDPTVIDKSLNNAYGVKKGQ